MHTRKTSGAHLVGAALATAVLVGSVAAQVPSEGRADAAGKAAAPLTPRCTIGRDDLARQGDYVEAVALSPDGRRLAVGCSISKAALDARKVGVSSVFQSLVEAIHADLRMN